MKKCLIIFLFLSLITPSFIYGQPYSQDEGLFAPLVRSKGNFNLEGKKFFLCQGTYSILGNIIDTGDQEYQLFKAYVRSSLSLRGAIETKDSLNADFYIKPTVKITGKKGEKAFKQRTPLSRSSKSNYKLYSETGDNRFNSNGQKIYYVGDNVSAENLKSVSGNVTSTTLGDMERTEWYNNKYSSDNNNLSIAKWQRFDKTINIEALLQSPNGLQSIWKATVSGSCFNNISSLYPNSAMLYALSSAYGRTVSRDLHYFPADDIFYLRFANFSLDNRTVIHPSNISSTKKADLFLFERNDDGISVILDDKGLNLDNSQDYRAYLKIGNDIVEAVSMTYSVRYRKIGHPFYRFLVLYFPIKSLNASTMELFFAKRDSSGKRLASFKDIKIN